MCYTDKCDSTLTWPWVYHDEKRYDNNKIKWKQSYSIMLFLFLQGMFSACKEWNCIIFLSPLLLSPCLVDKQHTSPLSWGLTRTWAEVKVRRCGEEGGKEGGAKKKGGRGEKKKEEEMRERRQGRWTRGGLKGTYIRHIIRHTHNCLTHFRVAVGV